MFTLIAYQRGSLWYRGHIWAERRKEQFVVRPLRIGVPLLSVCPKLHQCRLQPCPSHMTDLPTYLHQSPGDVCLSQL